MARADPLDHRPRSRRLQPAARGGGGAARGHGEEADHLSADDPSLRGSGWASRLLSTGRVAGAAARLGLRRLVRLRPGSAEAAIAEGLADELDRMKGMAMKVGQILSYMEGVLPEEAAGPLRELQRGAVRMPFDDVRAVLVRTFREPLEVLFESFEEEPAAAASIGQVHRAVHGAREVAVKVQYPGVADDVAADLGRLRRLGGLASLGTAVDGRAIVDELALRVAEECDYAREGRLQSWFREAFADDPRVVIPEVVEARTAGPVLTTAWAEGRDFYRFVQEATPAERDAAAATLVRFAWRSFFGLGTIQADPHPGNTLFPVMAADGAPRPHPPGTVVFLDFGCVRRFDPAFVEHERRIARAVLGDDRPAFRRAVRDAGHVPDEAGFDWDLHWRLERHRWAPYVPERFRFTREVVTAGMELARPTNPNLRRLAFPPEWIWLQRMQWGLHAVLGRLGAEGGFRAILEEALGASPLSRSPDRGED